MDRAAGPSRPLMTSSDLSVVVLEMVEPDQNGFPAGGVTLKDSANLETCLRMLKVESQIRECSLPHSEEDWNAWSKDQFENYLLSHIDELFPSNPSTMRHTPRINIPDDAFSFPKRLTVTNVEAQVDNWNLPLSLPMDEESLSNVGNVYSDPSLRTVITVEDTRNIEQVDHMNHEDGPEAAGDDNSDSVPVMIKMLDNRQVLQEPGQTNREAVSDLQSDHGHAPEKRWEIKCTICYQNVYGGQACFDAHMKHSHNVQCKCGSMYKHRRQLQAHIKDEKKRTRNNNGESKHGYMIPGRSRVPLQCDFCDLTFFGRPKAVAHRISEHPTEVKQWQLERQPPRRSQNLRTSRY